MFGYFTRHGESRPINIYLLRVLYFLMSLASVWKTRMIINHRGPWNHVKAVAGHLLNTNGSFFTGGRNPFFVWTESQRIDLILILYSY